MAIKKNITIDGIEICKANSLDFIINGPPDILSPPFLIIRAADTALLHHYLLLITSQKSRHGFYFEVRVKK